MIPRKILDIGWRDIVVGMSQCLARDKREQIYRACRSCTASPGDAEFFLSVRSGFDALLQALQFPAGSHILVHAITIPDILEIINGHGLVPVPVDLDPETLGIDLESLKSGLREETVGILVTHLFGGRVPMDAVVMFAREHGLLVIEDCAQGYWGDEFSGHPEVDVCMFSFGSIKHNTALGGGTVFHPRCRTQTQSKSDAQVLSAAESVAVFQKGVQIRGLKTVESAVALYYNFVRGRSVRGR